MPEYLSPGVYVEEVNTGSKPIEGVSTSTSGMVGVTERGPEDIPILVTSYGEFKRVFGGDLDLADFTDATGRVHGYLPHAVQGFFQNGGARNYVVRVLPDNATHGARFLFDRGEDTSVTTVLLRPAPQSSGTPVNQPLLYAINAGAFNPGDWVRVGEGSRAEYREIANSTAGDIHLPLSLPLNFAHEAGAVITPLARLEDAGFAGVYSLADAATRGAHTLVLTAIDAAHVTELVTATNPFLEIGAVGAAEYIRVLSSVALPGNQVRVTLASPLLLDADSGVDVTVIDATPVLPATALTLAANAGSLLLFPADITAATDFGGAPREEQLVIIGDMAGSGNVEIRRFGQLGELHLDVGAYANYPAGSRIQRIAMTEDAQTVAVATAADEFDINAVGSLAPGMTVSVTGNAGLATVREIDGVTVHLVAGLGSGPNVGDTLTIATRLTADVQAGGQVISLANRVGLAVGDLLRIGESPDEEIVAITRVIGNRGVAPDAGNVVLSSPLREFYSANTLVVHLQNTVVDTTQQSAYTLLAAQENSLHLLVSDNMSYSAAPDGFPADSFVRVTTPNGTTAFHRLVADATDITGVEIELAEALEFSHDTGDAMLEREALIAVQALDRGAWGNRLRIAVEDAATSVVQAEVTAMNPPLIISLNNFTGVERGTVLEFIDPLSGQALAAPVKVAGIDRAAGEIELDGVGLTPQHIAAQNAAQMAGRNLLVRSREFSLSVFLLQPPDPAVPSRNNRVIDSETFIVTMDPRHSRYIHKVIGTTWTPGNTDDDDGNPLRRWDRRSLGESNYIRVRDIAAGNLAVLESVRLGPEALTDVVDTGQQRAARLPLQGGDDAIATLISEPQGDSMYLGINSDEPQERSGIHALQNITDISILAVPGQTTTGVQQALITHCEVDRYRFAVLDAYGPGRDTLLDVQIQRQAFDTKYAALYHPWLAIPEPIPANQANNPQRAIPASGHIMGIYARTDNTRGVHKAPANEVIRGITGLTRNLNQREHDILNPFPRNINVIRDFREHNRGLRVWGARCITSDSDYKYVNVRRLMIFLEASIDRGLQWVVFEPNAEPLWARVRRSISNFLNVVWRNGALEGTTVDQAFYVKCDRTTMTQTDIDNGRLICEIGVAPVKPAEFVIVRIGLWTASAD